MIVAPLMTPILGIVLAVVLTDGPNLRRCLLDVQAVAGHWASGAGWSVTGVTATGDQVLIQATGPNPAPRLATLRHDLNTAGLNGLDVRVSLVPARFKPVPG
jgi:hypothetical protein